MSEAASPVLPLGGASHQGFVRVAEAGPLGMITLRADLSAAKTAKAVKAVAVLNHNLASASAPTLKVEGADDSGISVNAVTAKATCAPNARTYRFCFDGVRLSLVWSWSSSIWTDRRGRA